MANLIAPVTTGTFNSQIAWQITSYVIPDTEERIVRSINVEFNPTYWVKQTGFTYTKRKISPTSGTSRIGRISVGFQGDLTRSIFDTLQGLARALQGGGGLVAFRDSIMSDTTYTGKWVNAGDFVETSSILGTGTMDIDFYTAVGI